MRSGKRMNVLRGTALLAALGWCVDTFVLQAGGPESASAAASADSAPGGVQQRIDLDQVESLIRRLADGDETTAYRPWTRMLLRNPFTGEATVHNAASGAARSSGHAAEPGGKGAKLAGKEHFALEGVMLGEQPLAMVSGAVLGVGAELGGWRLVAIAADHVVFAREDETFRVCLDGDCPEAQ